MTRTTTRLIHQRVTFSEPPLSHGWVSTKSQSAADQPSAIVSSDGPNPPYQAVSTTAPIIGA